MLRVMRMRSCGHDNTARGTAGSLARLDSSDQRHYCNRQSLTRTGEGTELAIVNPFKLSAAGLQIKTLGLRRVRDFHLVWMLMHQCRSMKSLFYPIKRREVSVYILGKGPDANGSLCRLVDY
jgi:hypothetical protein